MSSYFFSISLIILRSRISSGVEHIPRLTKNDDVCITCHRCEAICAWVHDIVMNPKKGRVIVDLEYPDKNNLRICIQCGRCADACPMDAIYQDMNILTTSEMGIYRLDESKCTGCGKCIEACPTRVLQFYPDVRVPRKCDFCLGQPMCVRYCPTNALGWVLM